jgi:hypothetical protein
MRLVVNMANQKTYYTALTIVAAVGIALVVTMILFPDSAIGGAIAYAGNSVVDEFVVLLTSEESRLSQLEPETQSMVRQLLQNLANQGMQVHVGNSLRTQAQEKAAIESGHSAVKTHSWHELGRAVDLYPIDPDTNQPDMNGSNDALFVQMQQAAVALGFRQIAYDDNWNRRYITTSAGKKLWDGGHIEWHGPYATIADAVATEGSNYGIG